MIENDDNRPQPKPFLPLLLVCLLVACAAVWVNFQQPLEQIIARGGPGMQYRLGKCSYYGLGMKQSYVQAARWFVQATHGGDLRAQTALGLLYVQGRGVGRNYAAASTLFRRAANKGFAPAQNQLGMLYAEGRGMRQDLGAAAKWFSMAALQGLPAARQNLKLLAATRPDWMPKLTLRNGKTYQNVRVQRVEWEALTITFQPLHGGLGLARVAIKDLPEALQRHYSYSPNAQVQWASSAQLTAVQPQTL